jgi:RNA polymerase sigma-70 factor (ECF subfamily)
MNENDLAARAASGDAAAFARLVGLTQGRLRGFLLRLVRGDHALADDLAQETFLDAWRKLAQFRGTGRFSGWLYRIAWSRFLMHARTRRPECEALDETMPAPDSGLPPGERLDLEKAMAQISSAERAALTLCCALDFSHGEAADILGLPLGTVKSHIARGRDKLRALLQLEVGEQHG